MGLEEAKYKMIIRYLTRRYIGQIGKTQLYKILFFVDMDHSKTHKKTLTGDTYIKNTYGPTPKAVETVLNELKEDGYITVMKQDTPDGREKHLILNIKEYTDDELNNALSAAELESIVRRGNYCMGKNSEELSDISSEINKLSNEAKEIYQWAVEHTLRKIPHNPHRAPIPARVPVPD